MVSEQGSDSLGICIHCIHSHGIILHNNMLCFFSYRHLEGEGLEAEGHGDCHDQLRREGPTGSCHSYSASHGPPIFRKGLISMLPYAKSLQSDQIGDMIN